MEVGAQPTFGARLVCQLHISVYRSPFTKKKHPKIQIITIEELLDGARIDYPPSRQVDTTYKKAPRYVGKVAEELDLGGERLNDD